MHHSELNEGALNSEENYDTSVNCKRNMDDYMKLAKKYNYAVHITVNADIFIIKDYAIMKIIETKSYDLSIIHKTKIINILLTLTPHEQYIYNKILDNSEPNIDTIVHALDVASSYFEDYEISRQTQNLIDDFIFNFEQSNDIWDDLTSKPDYNLCIYKKRSLPYFNVGDKSWMKSGVDAFEKYYPDKIVNTDNMIDTADADDNTSVDADDDEKEYIRKHNNFLSWSLLPINQYKNIDLFIKRVKLFYNVGLVKQALNLFMRLMLSPRFCHVIKSSELWCLFDYYITTNKYIGMMVKYCFYYAMYILRQEETIMFSQVKKGYRVLFTLDEAAGLPLFKNTHIERNPYILQLTDDTRLSECIPFHITDGRVINNHEVFNKRFELATGGIFKNIDLKQLNAAVTGSILIPCVHTSPLEDNFDGLEWNRERENIVLKYPYMIDTPTDKKDIDFMNYLEYFYPSYCSLTDDDYKTQVISGAIELCDDENDIKYDDDSAVNDTKTLPVVKKIVTPVQPADSDSKSVAKIGYNQLSDIDISITSRSAIVFKKNALSLFYQIQKNCAHRGDVYIKEVKTISSTKFKIYGPGISRPIDVFRIPYGPDKMVKKFHVSCVKMYYNNSITMFRTCISALLSGVNEHYKWFSCNKIPIDVLFKYAQRGISIILNKKERAATSNFLKSDTRWGSIMRDMNISPKKIYCEVNVNHAFFHPGIIDSGIRSSLRKFQCAKKTRHSNSLVVPMSTSITPFGDLKIKDNNKQYPPNYYMINACLDYVGIL